MKSLLLSVPFLNYSADFNSTIDRVIQEECIHVSYMRITVEEMPEI